MAESLTDDEIVELLSANDSVIDTNKLKETLNKSSTG